MQHKNENADYLDLVRFYEQCFTVHGHAPQGVDWPNQQDLETRYHIMLSILLHEPRNKPLAVLDLGCGYGGLVEYLNRNAAQYPLIDYTGIDLSAKMILAAQQYYSNNQFFVKDILHNPLADNSVDYIIMNGLLTEKRHLTFEKMETFAKKIITAAFKSCRKGIAFDVMKYQVDWCSPHLFYWSYDTIADFLHHNCSKHFVFRADYGLYEYTVYVYKTARI